MIFLSYSKTDIEWRDKVVGHLAAHENTLGKKVTWVDSEIESGDEWKRLIEQNVATANVAIILVSHHYLGSGYIKDKELGPFLRRKNVKIFWFLLLPCSWEDTGLSEKQCANILNGKRLVPLQELMENNQSSKVDEILNKKTREAYTAALGEDGHRVPLPADLIYACNRRMETGFFQVGYLELFRRRGVLLYSILGDQEDSMDNFQRAVIQKVLSEDFPQHRINEPRVIFLPKTDVLLSGYVKTLFIGKLLNALNIGLDPDQRAKLTFSQLYELLAAANTEKELHLFAIKVQSTSFKEEDLVDILKWMADGVELAAVEDDRVRLLFVFLFEKTLRGTQDSTMSTFIDSYMGIRKIPRILADIANGMVVPSGQYVLDIGTHGKADAEALETWYEQDYKTWFQENAVTLPAGNERDFKERTGELFKAEPAVKMKLVEATLKDFIQ